MTKKIILDCDPGHDDAVAIMLAAASSEIEILGITCVGGNSGLNNTVNNALKVCTLIERTDLKIFSGCNKPIHFDLFTAEYVNGKTGLDATVYVSSNVNGPASSGLNRHRGVQQQRQGDGWRCSRLITHTNKN